MADIHIGQVNQVNQVQSRLFSKVEFRGENSEPLDFDQSADRAYLFIYFIVSS